MGWRQLPWAGLAALLLVLCVDFIALGPHGPWPELVSRADPYGSVYWGVARDRVELQRLRAAADGTPRVAVVGSSRGVNGFRRELAEARLPDVLFAELTHAMQDPATIRSLVPELVAAGANVVVLPLSQMDTHRPVRLEPLPAKSTSGTTVLAALMYNGGLSFSARNREALYRIGLSGLSNLYRFRDIVGRSGANLIREFPSHARLETRKGLVFRGPVALGEASPERLPQSQERALLAELPQRLQRNGYQLGWFTETRRGEHAAVQMSLLRGAVQELRGAGIRVLIAECPVHGIAKRLEGEGARAEFLELARELSAEDGVWFLPLAHAPRFEQSDFYDLFHLNARGGEKLTVSILALLPEVLTDNR